MQCVDALSAQILLVVVVLDAGDDLRDDGVERGGHAQPLAVARDGAVEHGDLRLALVQHGVLRHGRIVVAEVGDDVRLFLFHERPEIADAERLRDGAALFPHMDDDVVAVGVGEGLLHLQTHDGAHAVIAAVGDDFLPDVRAHILVKARVAAARLEARLERLAGGVGLRVVVHGAEVHLDALFRLAHAHAGAGQLRADQAAAVEDAVGLHELGEHLVVAEAVLQRDDRPSPARCRAWCRP